jgi:hypothetical protein
LPSRNDSDGFFLDVSLLSIDEIVSRNDTYRKCSVALQQGFGSVRDLLIVGPTHTHDFSRKLLQLQVKRACRMLDHDETSHSKNIFSAVFGCAINCGFSPVDSSLRCNVMHHLPLRPLSRSGQ